MIGVGVCLYAFPGQGAWWTDTLSGWADVSGVISVADDDAKRTDKEWTTPGARITGPNLGVAHTKNRALDYLMALECDPIVLVEGDCQFGREFLQRIAECAQMGIPHLMHGPVIEWPHTWQLTGEEWGPFASAGRKHPRLLEYRRRNDPQDTPGVITMVTRDALLKAGGLDARFIGRGHAHGEWTRRLFAHTQSALPHPYWILDVPERCRPVYLDRPPKPTRPSERDEIRTNASLRNDLLADRPRRSVAVPNLDYMVDKDDCGRVSISVCIALKNRADTLRRCLDSIRDWFAAEDISDNEVIVADFESDDCDPVAELDGRDLRHQVVQLDGFFSRARGLHRAAQAARNDILLFLDADMLVPKSFGATIRTFTGLGACLFPVCWNLDRGGLGTWRDTGYGMLAITAEDYERVGGWDTSRRRWGGEDNDIHWHCETRGLEVHRVQVNDFCHQWHPSRSEYRDRFTDPDAADWRPWTPPCTRDAVRAPLEVLNVPTARLIGAVDHGAPFLGVGGKGVEPFHIPTAIEFLADPTVPAEETSYYAGVRAYKRAGGALWKNVGNPPDPAKLRTWTERFRSLFLSMQERGFDGDPLVAQIRGAGGFDLVDGHHRLSCGVALGIDTVPVRIRTRHPDWVLLLDRLEEEYGECKLYTAIDHPEFANWAVARDTEHRAAAILSHLPDRKCRIVDVGANVGGISRALIRGGHRVVAIESSERRVLAGKAAERAEGLSNTISWRLENAWGSSVRDPDALVVLSVLHHALKDGTFDRALSWMRSANAALWFIEMADGTESQMAGRMLRHQETLGEWLEEKTGRRATPILEGVPADARMSASDRRWIWKLN